MRPSGPLVTLPRPSRQPHGWSSRITKQGRNVRVGRPRAPSGLWDFGQLCDLLGSHFLTINETETPVFRLRDYDRPVTSPDKQP